MIRVKASINAENIKEDSRVEIFKPHNMPARIMFLNEDSEAFIEFTGEIKEKDKPIFNFESFLYELGYVLDASIVNNVALIPVFKRAYDLLMTGTIEYAPEVKYADNSNAAKMTREILRDYPRIDKPRFIIEVGLLADREHHSENDVLEAIVNYG